MLPSTNLSALLSILPRDPCSFDLRITASDSGFDAAAAVSALLAMLSTRPSIVVVPGAHHIPEHFKPVTALLDTDGYRVIGVKLSSPDDKTLPPGFQGDLTIIRKAIEGELRLGHDVLLVVHSAGGVTGPAAMQGLAKKAGSSEPGVIRILAITAILTLPGQLASDVLKGRTCQWRAREKDRYVVLAYDHPGEPPKRPERGACSPLAALYNDMTEQQCRWAYDMLVPGYGDQLGVPVNYAGWQDVPLTYVICEKDLALFPEVQEDIIRNTGVDTAIRRLAASHTPYVSVPEKVAALIKEAAGQA